MKNLLIILISFALILCISNTIGQNPCLVAWYKLDANAADSSGNNYHGALEGTTPTTDRFLNANSAAHFDGTSDYVTLGSDFDYPERTISLWFKVDFYPTNWGAIYAVDHSGLQYGMLGITVVQQSGLNMIRCNVGTIVNSTYSNVLKEDVWYHIAVVVRSSYFKCFFMGNVIDSLPNTNFGHSADGDNVAHLGCSRNFGYFFPGAIDEVQIFNCALSDDEIHDIYSDGVDIFETNAANSPSIEVYPNPANNQLTIDLPTFSRNNNAICSIFNIDGKLLKSMTINEKTTTVDISELPSGVYIIKGDFY